MDRGVADGLSEVRSTLALPGRLETQAPGRESSTLDTGTRGTEVQGPVEKFEASEERYQALLEIVPAAVLVVQEDGLTYANPQAERLLGYGRQEMLGLPPTRVFHPDDIHELRRQSQTFPAGMILPGRTVRALGRDAEVRWVETLGRRVQWKGRPADLFFCTDVSARVEAEQQHRISESKYRSLVELAPEAISVVEAGAVTFCNSHFLEMLGYTNAEMIGTRIEQITYKDDLASAVERYQRRVEGRVLPKTVFRHVRKDGSVIWVETVGQSIEWEGRPAVLYFSSDITERRALEEKFVHAQKMESVGRLAGGIAHDFNNILQIILGYCEILLSAGSNADVPRVVGTIKQSAERAAALTMQLLAFSRKQSVTLAPVDVAALVRDSRSMLAKLLGEDIRISVEAGGGEAGDGAAVVRADSGQLQQVLMNLAVNARDAMPEGGDLTIRVSRAAVGEADEERPVELPPGDYVLLQVSDSGVGMDREVLSHLFEPFFTTKGVGRGTGLGLSIVYGIVKETGGHIVVESQPGEGTTFRVYLPRSPEAAPAELPLLETQKVGTETVLLVEDEDAVRELVLQKLEACGYHVLTAADGAQAVEMCKAGSGRIHLLVTDVLLPGMRGTRVAEAFRAFNPAGKVIYMTGYTDTSGFEDLARREGATVLQKPFTLSTLAGAIRRVLNGHSG